MPVRVRVDVDEFCTTALSVRGAGSPSLYHSYIGASPTAVTVRLILVVSHNTSPTGSVVIKVVTGTVNVTWFVFTIVPQAFDILQ